MNYISIKDCECTIKYTCLNHRPDYNYSFLGYTLEDILKKEMISLEDYRIILQKKSINNIPK